mgnify:FL=1
MKKIFLLLGFVMGGLCAEAQQADPVLMTVNGKAVTRAEFEYAYNKNQGPEGAVEDVPLDKYVDMFINYKLKVAEAERLQMDTLTSYNEEFRTYRDMQLTPALVDEVYIDSVARSVYQRTVDMLDGRELLHPAHILMLARQNATEAERTEARRRIDSIYNALQAGADFATLASTLSQDPGSARQGGALPWIGPGNTIPEFETAAYKLKAGETSPVVETAVGFHIIKMLERKALEPYDSLSTQIVESLKRQNIEEASAQAKIEKLIAETGKTREDIMLEAQAQLEKDDPSLHWLVQEYHDGLLLYEVCKRNVWDPADANTEGHAAWFKSHKKQYAWTQPHFKGFVYHTATNDKKLRKQVEKLLKQYGEGDWRAELKKTVNKDSVVVSVHGPFIAAQGENAYVDEAAFGQPQTRPMKKFPFIGKVGKIQKQPKAYTDVKQQVIEDYKRDCEERWVEELRQRYTFSVDKEVLKTVNNHE